MLHAPIGLIVNNAKRLSPIVDGGIRHDVHPINDTAKLHLPHRAIDQHVEYQRTRCFQSLDFKGFQFAVISQQLLEKGLNNLLNEDVFADLLFRHGTT